MKYIISYISLIILSACGQSGGGGVPGLNHIMPGGGHTYTLVIQGPPGTQFTADFYVDSFAQPNFQEIVTAPTAIDGTGSFAETLVGPSAKVQVTRLSSNGGILSATLYKDGVQVQGGGMNSASDSCDFPVF